MGELYDMHPNLQFQFLECLGLNNGNVKEFANNLKINKNLNHLFINGIYIFFLLLLFVIK